MISIPVSSGGCGNSFRAENSSHYIRRQTAELGYYLTEEYWGMSLG